MSLQLIAGRMELRFGLAAQIVFFGVARLPKPPGKIEF